MKIFEKQMNKNFKFYLESINQNINIVYIDMDGVLADLDMKQKNFIKNNYQDIFKDEELKNLWHLTQKEKKKY